MFIAEGAEDRARRVRAILMDADGILTAGGILVAPGGEEWKLFDARDGLGLRIARETGFLLGVISGRRSSALERRAHELRFDEIHQGVTDKLRVFEAVIARWKIPPEEVAYLGDDLVDAPVLRRAGFAATVPDAAEEIRRLVHFVSSHPGGRGAVREVIEYILRTQGRWESVLKSYGAV